MPLELLLVLVIGGIGSIALLLHLTGYSAIKPMDNDTARAGWLRHFPDDPALDLTLSGDGRAALVRTHTARGLVWQVGADTTARKLGDHHFTDTAHGLLLRFDDFGSPRLKLRLSDKERAHWKVLLS